MKCFALVSLIILPLAALAQVVTVTVTVTATSGAPTSTVVPTTTVRPPITSTVTTTVRPPSSSVPGSTAPAPTGTPITLTASYDAAYGNAGQSLGTTACSDGPNGLLTKGFTTFGSLPSFPRIGGAFNIAGWNSAGCGTCWSLTYQNNATSTTTINVLAVDVAVSSFNISPAAMNLLTNGRAVELGRVNVVARQIAASACGL